MFVFVHMFAQRSPWFMRPPLRCGEYWTEWVGPPGLGRNVWSEATASQTPLWSAARRPTALRGQRSPQGGLHLHLQRKGYRWNHTLHLYSFQFMESLRSEDWDEIWDKNILRLGFSLSLRSRLIGPKDTVWDRGMSLRVLIKASSAEQFCLGNINKSMNGKEKQ